VALRRLCTNCLIDTTRGMCYTRLWKLGLEEESHREVDTMKIVVLGGYGDIGQGAVQDLIAHTDAEVVIADYRIEKAKEYAAQLGPRATAVFVDANDPALLASVVQGADAVVGAIGPFYRYALKMATAAVQARVNYVDICDDYGPIREVFALDEVAKAAGVTLITGLGWTPGIPAAIGGLMLAQAEVKAKGVYAPEGCLEPEPFFAELAKRDIKIEETAAS